MDYFTFSKLVLQDGVKKHLSDIGANWSANMLGIGFQNLLLNNTNCDKGIRHVTARSKTELCDGIMPSAGQSVVCKQVPKYCMKIMCVS